MPRHRATPLSLAYTVFTVAACTLILWIAIIQRVF